MAITKLGSKLIKEAATAWKHAFHYLSPENQMAIRRGTRGVLREKPVLEFDAARQPGKRFIEKHQIRSPIIKSKRAYLLGKIKANQNRMERFGYFPADVIKTPKEVINTYANELQSRILNYTDPAKLKRDIDALDNLKAFNGKNPRATNTSSYEFFNAPIRADPFTKLLFTKNFRAPKTGKAPAAGKILKVDPKIKKPENMRMLGAFVDSHELNEVQSIEKRIMKYLEDPKNASRSVRDAYYATAGKVKYPGRLKNLADGERRAIHDSLSVLTRERRELDLMPYDTPATLFVRESRNHAGEGRYLDRGANWDPAKAILPGKPVDTFQKHEKQLFKNSRNPIDIGDEIWIPHNYKSKKP